MKIIHLILLLTTVLYSCRKDQPITTSKEKNQNNPDSIFSHSVDSIFYIDLRDTIIQSFVSYNSTWNCNRPVPQDSVANYKLDLTGDGQEDITFTCSNAYNFVSASNPCTNYSYSIICNTIINNDGAVCLSNGMLDTLSSGNTIDSLCLFRSGGSALKIISPGFSFSWPIDKDYYIGLKLIRNNKIMYGWVLVNLGIYYNSLTIKAYALNKSNNLNISAGQTN